MGAKLSKSAMVREVLTKKGVDTETDVIIADVFENHSVSLNNPEGRNAISNTRYEMRHRDKKANTAESPAQTKDLDGKAFANSMGQPFVPPVRVPTLVGAGPDKSAKKKGKKKGSKKTVVSPPAEKKPQDTLDTLISRLTQTREGICNLEKQEQIIVANIKRRFAHYDSILTSMGVHDINNEPSVEEPRSETEPAAHGGNNHPDNV